MTVSPKGFGGLFPKLSAEALPEAGAQTAENLRLDQGILTPISVSAPILSMHSNGSGMPLIGDIPSGDQQVTISSLAKGATPTLSSRSNKCQPTSGTDWLIIHAYFWVTYINDDGVLACNEYYDADAPV